jgi:gliding motility-associated protein GldM
MAGGKETPRQKLIGIMYLILLALLALQVSSAIMEKFKFLDDSLQFANDAADKNNDKVEQSIDKAVRDNGSKPKDVAVLEKAKQVRKEATEIKTYIDKIRKQLIETTGGLENPEDPNSMYKGAKSETEVEVLMVGADGSKKGKGYELQKEVNQFCADLSKVTGKKFPDIALDGKDDKRISEKDQKKKDFAELNFAQTPMVAAMAVLSNLESDVLKHETNALADIQSEIGADEIKFDQILATYRADSRIVAAGTKYTAYLFIAASSSTLKPTISAEGRNLPVEKGEGKLEFTATGGAYNSEGNANKTWNGKITIKNKGKDTTFNVKGEYVVARPVIQVQSASVSALYRNCGNELNIQVPALGSLYAPSFQASGVSAVIPGSKKGYVTLVPNAPQVSLKVSSGGNFIGEENFKVRLIPKPDIQAMNGAKPVDEKQGVPAPGPASITMKANPDESFKTFLPNDARYKVTEWEAILVRGRRPVKQKTFTTDNGSFSDFRAVAQAGDRIVIDVKTVKRMNFKNEIENVSIPTTIKNIPLN